MLSVITLVRDRNRMLSDFLRGWAGQSLDRIEVIVVRAGGHEDPLEVADRFESLPIEHVTLDNRWNSERIAYSHARNAGAIAASGDRLVFCDADTIPDAHLGHVLHHALGRTDGLLTADIGYLPPDADVTLPIDELAECARRHPSRPTPPPPGTIDTTLRHEMVWGLCMAIRASTFRELGGFDECYRGYAGEDTDLARAVAASGRPAGLVGGARVLHQHHDSFEPPLHQMEATVRNAERYRDKWGVWPMEGWLEEMEELGLVVRRETGIHIRRLPTANEVEASRCTEAAPFR